MRDLGLKRLSGATVLGAVCVAASLAVAATAQAQSSKSLLDQILDRKELRVGVELKYPPIMYRDTNGNPQGFEVDMARAMCSNLKVMCTFVDVEFPALISALQAGKIDIIMAQMAITPARATVVDFCKPFEATGNVITVPPGSPLGPSTTAGDAIAALNKPDIKVAVQFGSVAAQIRGTVLPQSQAVEVNGPLDAFLQIVAHRADAAITDDVSALKFLKEHPGSTKVILDGRSQPYLRNFPSGGGVLRGNGDFCRFVDVQIQDWINSGQYFATYMKDVGWAPPLQQLQLLRGGY